MLLKYEMHCERGDHLLYVKMTVSRLGSQGGWSWLTICSDLLVKDQGSPLPHRSTSVLMQLLKVVQKKKHGFPNAVLDISELCG